jgi:lysophospholipase L1-like esterase
MTWGVLGVLSLACTILLAAGFAAAAKHIMMPGESGLETVPRTSAPAAPVQDGQFHLVALGDSLTKGTGDAAGGLGYPGRVKQALERLTDEPVYLINFAVEGYTAAQLLSDLQSGQGDMAAVAKADAVMLTIGGNDVFDPARALDTGISVEEAEAAMDAALERIEAVIRRIRELNPQVPVYYIGLYNPFADLPAVAQEAASFVRDWNYKLERRVAFDPLTFLIPTYDLFAYNVTRYLSFDHYHPNADGYARIAVRVTQAIAARFGFEEG